MKDAVRRVHGREVSQVRGGEEQQRQRREEEKKDKRVREARAVPQEGIKTIRLVCALEFGARAVSVDAELLKAEDAPTKGGKAQSDAGIRGSSAVKPIPKIPSRTT